MKSTILLFTSFLAFSLSYAQDKPSDAVISDSPLWAQMMYSTNPNVYEVDQSYIDYYQTNLFEKSFHTQYYIRWRRSVIDNITAAGFVEFPSTEDQMILRDDIILNSESGNRSGTWSLLGPELVYNSS